MRGWITSAQNKPKTHRFLLSCFVECADSDSSDTSMRSLFLALSVLCLMAEGHVACAGSVTEANENAQKAAQSSFYRRNAEGWYWYKDPEEEKEPEQPVQPVAPPPPPPLKPEPVEVKEEKPPQPAPFSAAWVREKLPVYRDLAWTNPTPENVKAYFLLQRFAVDRSQKFAEVAQQITIGNPLLDETFRRPTATYGVHQVDRDAYERSMEVMKKIREKAGLFFFFKSGCSYCESEAPLIGNFEKDDFDVIAISVDGGTLESYQFKNVRRDQGHAAQLGVTATPALFLVSGDGVFENLGQGLLSYNDIRRRIFIAAQRQGWISEEDFQETKPILNPETQIDFSEELPKLLMAQSNPIYAFGDAESNDAVASMPVSETQHLIDENGFIEPKQLVSLFNGAKTSGQFEPELLDEQPKN